MNQQSTANAAAAPAAPVALDGQFHERPFSPISGWLMLPVTLALIAGAVWLVITAAREATPTPILGAIPAFLLFVLSLCGYFIVNPNESRALVLFGHP